MAEVGHVAKVSGPVVTATGMRGSRMFETVYVGEGRLIGEIIRLEGDAATIQVYEETSGLVPGEVVRGTGLSLSVELGPGLLGRIFDGIQRPLVRIREIAGEFITRGLSVPPLDRESRWDFTPHVAPGEAVTPGDILGRVPESPAISHAIMVPPHVSGRVQWIAPQGKYTVEDEIARIETVGGTVPVRMLQRWPVREPRPYARKLPPELPLITGQRAIDTLFPIAKGGTATVPGPFGSGKTVVQQQLARWVDAEIIVYVGCGERGNEMADVLQHFPQLQDPRTGEPLMGRTILIANTSNMPVAAREASVYTGITIAEYYRDMGYDVALIADSTSRWAEAMREISGRLEEMPGEEGYPAYLGSRLAEFYERAGRVVVSGAKERVGSITVIGAVSPPGGDFSEPVTQNTLRIVKVFWALDAELAYRRHFPAINWLTSYSLYTGQVREWWHRQTGPEWDRWRAEMMGLLQKEAELREIVQLVGMDVLPERDRLVLLMADMVRSSYLVQYAFHPVDTYCPPLKQYSMMRILSGFYEHARKAVERGVPAESVRGMPIRTTIARLGTIPNAEYPERFRAIEEEMGNEFARLLAKSAVEPGAMDAGEGGTGG